MRRLLAALLPIVTSAAPTLAADSAHPVVVELYQSQGCSSCPPAIAILNAIADRPDVLALTFAVTYWDQLGWKDTFAKPAFTARQWDYARTGGRTQVVTPQTIVNGRAVINGGNRAEIMRAIGSADRGSSGPGIEATGTRVTIDAGSAARSATVWLVRYDRRTLDVPIRAGENGGKTLAHRNVVRSLHRLGEWTGVRASFALPATGSPTYRRAIIVQQGVGGPIIAAAKL